MKADIAKHSPFVTKTVASLIIAAVFVAIIVPAIFGTYANVCDGYPSEAHEQNCASYYTVVAWLLISATFVERWHTVIEVIFTGLVALFTYTLWQSTKNLWEETRDASDIARRTLEATNRPWLNFKVETLSGFEIKGGLLTLEIKLTISNIGKSPAKAIKADAFVPSLEDITKGGWPATLEREAGSQRLQKFRGMHAFPAPGDVIIKLKARIAIPEKPLPRITVWVGYMNTFLGPRQPIRYSAISFEVFKREIVAGKKAKVAITGFEHAHLVPQEILILREKERFIS